MQDKNIELIQAIISTKQELYTADKNFETAEDEMIDYYVYQIKANKSKLDYLTKKAKSQGVMLDMISGISLSVFNQEAI